MVGGAGALAGMVPGAEGLGALAAAGAAAGAIPAAPAPPDTPKSTALAEPAKPAEPEGGGGDEGGGDEGGEAKCADFFVKECAPPPPFSLRYPPLTHYMQAAQISSPASASCTTPTVA